MGQNWHEGGSFYYRGDHYVKVRNKPYFAIYGGTGGGGGGGGGAGLLGYEGGPTFFDKETGIGYINGESVSTSCFLTHFISNIVDPSNYTTYKWGQTGSRTGDLPNGELYVSPVYGWTTFESSSKSGNTQSLIPTSDIAWGINGAGWLWGVTATLNATDFNIDAASRAAGKLATKVGVGINIAGTAAEGYDLIQNWEHAGRGDVAKFGLDAAITTTTTILYLTGVGAPVAIVLTGVQIANTLGAFDFFYEKINTPINGAGGSW